MSHDPPTTEDPGRARAPRAAMAIGAIAVAVSGSFALFGGDRAAPPDSTVAASSSTSSRPPATTSTTTTPVTVPSTSLPSFVAEFSPFVQHDLVSTTNAIPENPAIDSPAAAIYVDAAAGSDSALGTVDAPVATLEAARALARDALRDATGDVVVYLRSGIHPRRDTFTLTFQDSGRNGFDMVYRSFPGEQAVIEGGIPVQEWRTAFDSVVVAEVPEGVVDMRQFFANGERQQRARSAEASATAVEFVKGPLFNQERNVAMTVDSALLADISKPENLELVYVGVAVAGHGQANTNGAERLRPSWKSHRLRVASATEVGGGLTRLDIAAGGLYHASERGYLPLALLPTDPFYLENAIELLDEPGEFFFDEDARLLYWWPPSAEATSDAWIPATEVLLTVDGTPSRPVHDVRFEGIVFRHSAYLLPNETGAVISQAANWFTGWRMADWMEVDGARHSFLDGDRFPGLPGAAIQVDSVRDIAFTSNVFTELGAVGVMLHNDVVRATLNGNLFVDISAAAVVAGHPAHDEIDEPMEGAIADLTFSNNVIDRAAAEFYGSVGIQVTKAAGANLSHNLFRDLPYSAMSIGWGWNDNPSSTVHRAITVEGNYFENVVNLLYDGAPIYLLGPVAEPGAARRDFVQIRGNFANNAGADLQFRAPADQVETTFAKRPGVQFDEGTRNVLISDNVFVGFTRWLQLTAWQGNRNTPGWAEDLALIGRNNWSDEPASEPADTTLIGIEAVTPFDVSNLPDPVLAIITAAGLDPGVSIPPLPD